MTQLINQLVTEVFVEQPWLHRACSRLVTLIDLRLCCGCYLDCPLGLLSNEGGGRGWGKGC